MRKVPKLIRFLPLSAVLLVAPGVGPVAQAQQSASNEPIEEIITTGTRRAARTESQSSVPIDVISGQEFENMGTADLDVPRLLRTLEAFQTQVLPRVDA